MELNDLKLFALFYIKEQDLSDQDKIQLMNFVEGASGGEILFLLSTGQIPSDNNVLVRESGGQAYRVEALNPKAADIVGRIGHKASVGYMWTSQGINAMATSLALKVRKEKLAQLSVKCDNEKGMAKKSCYNMIKRDAIRAEILALSSMKTKCHKSNTAETCIKNIDKRIKQLQQKMDTIKVST